MRTQVRDIEIDEYRCVSPGLQLSVESTAQEIGYDGVVGIMQEDPIELWIARGGRGRQSRKKCTTRMLAKSCDLVTHVEGCVVAEEGAVGMAGREYV